MNKDEVQGKGRDLAGKVQRKVGEMTGDTEQEVKGAANQVAGKTQHAWGKAKEVGKEAVEDIQHKKDEMARKAHEERAEIEKQKKRPA